MNKGSLLENLSIYNDNLSIYYLASVFLTILSVILAWWYHSNADLRPIEEPLQNKTEKIECDRKESLFQECESDGIAKDLDNDEEIISKIKLGKCSLLAEEMAASLTQEQLHEEREVEKQQLQAIFQLLQNQEDKFQVSSIQDLQDQLKLYRQ